MQVISSGSRTLKIAVIGSRVLPPQVPLFNSLAEISGVEFHLLVCSDVRQSLPERIRFSGNVNYELIRGLEIKLSNQSLFSYFVNPLIWKRLGKHRFDVIILAGYHLFTTQVAMLWARLNRIPYILYSESHFHRPISNWKRLLKMLVLPPIVTGASSYIALGTWASEYLQSYGAPPELIFVVPYLPERQSLLVKDPAERFRLRQSLQIENLPTVLYVGRLVKIKGVKHLLEAFKRVVVCGVKAQLILVGDGPDRLYFRKFVEDNCIPNVRFVGAQPLRRLKDFYRAADLFVLPSIDEPFGAVVTEAMACGLPVITTDRVGSAADFVYPGGNGEIVPAGDVLTLSEALLQLLRDDALRIAMGLNSLRIISKWSIERSVQNFLSSIECAVNRSRTN